MAKVSGGMKKDWISEVRRASPVSKEITNVGTQAMQDAETSMQLEGALYGYGWDYYYGSAELNGKHGRTFVFWATNETSMDDADAAFEAARSAGAIPSDEARSKR